MKTIGAIFEQPTIEVNKVPAQEVPAERTDVAETEKVDYNWIRGRVNPIARGMPCAADRGGRQQ